MVSFERQSCAQADKFLEFKIEEIKKYLDLLMMTMSSNISDVYETYHGPWEGEGQK